MRRKQRQSLIKQEILNTSIRTQKKGCGLLRLHRYFDKKSEMVKDVNSIKWDSANAYGTAKLTPGKKRALVWGMALHTLSDTFAHSVYIYDREKGRYRHLEHQILNII